MLKIDVHTHILPKSLPRWREKFGYGGFLDLEHDHAGCARLIKEDGSLFREVESNCFDTAARIAELDSEMVDVQVISTVPVLFSYWAKPEHGAEISQYINDDIASSVENNPRRFIGLGTVPMQDTSLAIRELERCKTIGLAGIEIGTNINRANLGEVKFREFFAACEELGMPIFVHPWEMMGEEEMSEYWLPWLVGMPAETTRAICSLIFSGTLERCPKLRICFAHGGGSFPSTIGRIMKGFTARPDLCAKDNPIAPESYFKKVWFDSLTHDIKTLKRLIGLAGADRVAMGSDYPFPLGDLTPVKTILESGFDDATKENLFNKSALSWLGITKDRFAD
jgi:aminocarboxymuconate-semialdehyde decarboxylase